MPRYTGQELTFAAFLCTLIGLGFGFFLACVWPGDTPENMNDKT